MARRTVAVDTSSVTGKDLGVVSSTTLSVTIADNPNMVSVIVNAGRNGGDMATGVSRDGNAYTLALRTNTTGLLVEIWYLINPNADTGNVTVEFGGDREGDRGVLGHVALYNVDTSDPVNITDKLDGTANSISNLFTATENNCVAVDGQFNTGEVGGTQASGQSLIHKQSANDSGGCSYETNIDAQAEAMGWTGLGASSNYSHAVVVFQGVIPRRPKVIAIL